MPLDNLLRQAGETWEVPRDLLLRRYPAFVTGGDLPRGQVPVFAFHGAEPERLERQLEHLARNGYRTLTLPEYVGVLQGTHPAPERAVLLTFDDGRGSLWTVARPLLARHDMRAVVFLVPGRMRDRPPSGPDWDDVRAGRAAAEAVLSREEGEGALLSWEEAVALSRSGLFELQSHTLTHCRVHVSPGLAGFATPDARRGYAAFDLPLVRTGEEDLLGEDVPLGTPLLRSAPRLAEAFRFLEHPGFREACLARVAREGTAFFDRPGWERELRRLTSRPAGRRETPEERLAGMRRELAEARRLIEERTGSVVEHLCYPWHAWGSTARRLAAEAGYRTAFAGKVPGVPLTLPGGDPGRIARVGEDYLELLPGRGRETLAAVLSRKWSRRFRSPARPGA